MKKYFIYLSAALMSLSAIASTKAMAEDDMERFPIIEDVQQSDDCRRCGVIADACRSCK